MQKRETATTQSPPVITTEQVGQIRKRIIEKLRQLGVIKQTDNYIPNDLPLAKVKDRRNSTTMLTLNQQSLLTSLARILLPAGDPCACIEIDNTGKGRIFWSCNHSLTNQHQTAEVMEVVEIFCKLAEKPEEQDAKELRKKLLQRAILKDADYCVRPKIRRTYCDHLKGNYAESWEKFEASFSHFKKIVKEEGSLTEISRTHASSSQTKEEIMSSHQEQQQRDQILRSALESRCELVSSLLEIEKERRKNQKELPYHLFKVLFNVTDLLVILREITDESSWWRGIAAAFQRETKTQGSGFQIIKSKIEMHAEMKMLEEETDHKKVPSTQMRAFVDKMSRSPSTSQFAVTKRFCLNCELALTACEKASLAFPENLRRAKETKVTAVNPTSKVFFEGWVSFHLENEQLRGKIRSLFSKLFDDFIEKVNQRFTNEEGAWIERQVVGVNLRNEGGECRDFFF